MPPTNTDSTVEDVGSDRIRGVKKIANFLNEDERRVAYLVERGIIPVGREGTAIIASKARLRDYHRKITGSDTARELAEWGAAGREYLARRAEAGTLKGAAYAAYLEGLAAAEAAAEVRAMFALVASEDLAGEIANDLQLDPEKAELIAREIQATRLRLEPATRAFRRRGEPADNEAG